MDRVQLNLIDDVLNVSMYKSKISETREFSLKECVVSTYFVRNLLRLKVPI